MFALARRFKDMPINLHNEAYVVACEHIERNIPPTGVYLHAALMRGEIICFSFIIMQNIFDSCSQAVLDAERFVVLWNRASAWASYLRHAVDYLRTHGMSNDQKDTCVLYAEGISSFLKASKIKGCFHGENMVNSIADFWAMRSEIPEVVDHTADALKFFLSSIGDPVLNALLNRLQIIFSTSRDVALHAMNNVRMALSPNIDRRTSTDRVQYFVLLLLVVLRPTHAISRAILKEGAILLALDTMSHILSETNPDDKQRTLLEVCIQIVSHAYKRPRDGCTWIRQGFKHGQINILVQLMKRLPILDQDSHDVVREMLTGSILPYLHLSGIFKLARRDMISFTTELNNVPFNIQELPNGFRGVWTEFETSLLEHAILRCMRSLGYEDEDVYCGNVSDYNSLFN